jgi:hypothetical protein
LLMKNNKKTLGKFLLMKKKEKERFENFCYWKRRKKEDWKILADNKEGKESLENSC